MIIDLLFLLLMLIALFRGLRQGFIIALFSVVAFILGIAAALKLSAVVAARLSDHLQSYAKWLPLLSFILVFLAVVILVNLGAKLLQKSVEFVMLGWLNKLAGVALYALLYAIFFSVFLFYAVQLHFFKPETIAASSCYPVIQPLGPILINALGSIIPLFKNMFEQLQDFFGSLQGSKAVA